MARTTGAAPWESDSTAVGRAELGGRIVVNVRRQVVQWELRPLDARRLAAALDSLESDAARDDAATLRRAVARLLGGAQR